MGRSVYYVLVFFHVVVSVVLILVVLLQTGKRADLAGAFGGGGSQTAFGTRGAATFLSKATTAAAVMFMLTSLGLSFYSGGKAERGGTVLPDVPPAQEQGSPLGTSDGGVTDLPALPPVEQPAPADSSPPATGDTGSTDTEPGSGQ